MSPSAIAVLTSILAGVCIGSSGILSLRRPRPGWLISGLLAVWLTLLYSSTWAV